MKQGVRTISRARGFLSALARDMRGNTLALMAAAMIPLAGMVGGGLDLSRMYIVKTRLQHACDAGALAGRKAMGGGMWSQDNYKPRVVANRFFDSNIEQGAYGATRITKSFTESGGKVTGTASAVLPMTIMRIFGNTEATLSVTCDAEMRLPNTDVMFVLDITGSMNCVAGDASCTNNGEVPAPGSKIDGLKVAVKCFYEIVARLDTDAACEGGAPSGGTGDQVQIRFGFVPYATNVNVGKLLPTNFLADSWTYQSRERVGSGWSDWDNDGYTGTNHGTCTKRTDTETSQYRVTKIWYWGNAYCHHEVRHLAPLWDYAPLSIDISGLKNGTEWNDSFVVPAINDDGSDRTVEWDGCIEERMTVRTTDFDPIPEDAHDLDILTAPKAGDADSLWGPALPDVVFRRPTYEPIEGTTEDYSSNPSYSCATEARKLQRWPNADAFEAYVDSFEGRGNTYHDIGLIWGARFLAPTGIFRAENEFTPQGGEIERHLIFMTDGDTQTSSSGYAAYGYPPLDRRQTPEDEWPTGWMLDQQVNLRFSAVCREVRNQNITLWVISFGGGLDEDTEDRLEACATPGRYFKADDPAALQRTFQSIANQISQLRLTK